MNDILRNNFARVLVIAFALVSLPVSALNLDQAKKQGLLKETPNGTVEVTDKVTKVDPNLAGEVKELKNRVNTGRISEYKKIAKKRGTSLEAVQKLAGEKLTK